MKILRRYECDLPIEVFHFPGELTNQVHRREIEKLGGKVFQIDELVKDEGAWKVCFFPLFLRACRLFYLGFDAFLLTPVVDAIQQNFQVGLCLTWRRMGK